jgi:hypothetical protein
MQAISSILMILPRVTFKSSMKKYNFLGTETPAALPEKVN